MQDPESPHCLDSELCSSVPDFDNGVSGKQYFDLDRCINPDGLRIPAVIGQVCRRRNSEGIALSTDCEANDAVGSNGARRNASIRYDVQVRVTLNSRFQYRSCEAPVRVNDSIHIDRGPDWRWSATIA